MKTKKLDDVDQHIKLRLEKTQDLLNWMDEDLLYATYGRKKGSNISVQVATVFNEIMELQRRIEL